MRNTDILIIDSGISKRHRGYVNIVESNMDYLDLNGHGSQIIDTLRLVNSKFKISSLRVLDEKRECTLQNLLDNLAKSLEIDAKVVLLALSVEIQTKNAELQDIIRQLSLQGKVIISAVFNGYNISIPAKYKDVIGVKIGKLNHDFSYFDGGRPIQCVIPVEQVICESIDDIYTTFSGNSLASTLFTGHVANTIVSGNYINRKELDNCLENETYDNISYKRLIEISDNAMIQCERKDEIKTILHEISKEIKVSWHKNSLIDGINDLNHLNVFVKYMLEKGLKLNSKNLLLLRYLENVDMLVNYLYGQELR